MADYRSIPGPPPLRGENPVENVLRFSSDPLELCSEHGGDRHDPQTGEAVRLGSKEALLPEDEGSQKREEEGEKKNGGEGLWVLLKRQGNVHPVQAGQHDGDGQDNGDGSEGFHHMVLVVGDDRCEGVHHSAQDGAVDLAHLQGLLDLDQSIFQQLFIFFKHGEIAVAKQFFHDQVVAVQRGHEINQAFLQTEQCEQFLVLQGLLQLLFDVIGLLIDLFEVLQIIESHAVKELQHKPGLLVCEKLSDTSPDEVLQNGVVPKADGDEHLFVHHHSQGNRSVPLLGRIRLPIDGDIHNHQKHIPFPFDAGPFVDVQRVPDHMGRQIPLSDHLPDLLFRGIHQGNPATSPCFLHLRQPAASLRPIYLQHEIPPSI